MKIEAEKIRRYEDEKRGKCLSSKFHNFSTSQQSGFTLIELIIVLFIIGIAAGLVGVMVGKGSESLAIKTFTKEVSAALRYARSHAVTEKKTYCFVVDKNEGKFRLYTDKVMKADENSATAAEDTGEKQFVDVLNKAIPEVLQMTVKDQEDDNLFIEFFPLGNSSGGTIEITSEQGLTFFVVVNRITGKVEVIKGEG
ncbi:MAG: GspH/FimT family pseudopilin [Nitrospirae bacterium]|nr:GspH/FimT family pseudopilin [Nitrospirota bacterium]